MLKGIKKSKDTDQASQQINPQQNEKITHQQKERNRDQQIHEHEVKLFTSSQNAMKEQFIMEEEQEEKQPSVKEPTQNKVPNKLLSNLKQKALQILQIFTQGDIDKVQQKLNHFDKLQKAYISRSKHLAPRQKLSTTNQQLMYQGFPTEEQQPKSQPTKGRFDYNFNYQEDQQEKSKKSLKRTNKSRPIMRSQKIQDYCINCPDNEEIKLISASNYVYLAFPKKKTFHKYWHFILAPVQHQPTTIGLAEDVLTELSNYKKCLLQMFDKKNYMVVFFEQFSQQNSHIYIECLAVPYSKGQDFPFFFKQSLETVQGNWTTHNSLIKIEKQKGGLQRQIPKKINYFYIDFSLGYGYAHVIENDKQWKRQFVYEVIATALGVQLYEIKTAAEFTDEELETKEQEFKKMWEPFDWTKCL